MLHAKSGHAGGFDGLLIAGAALALCLSLTSPSSYGDGPYLLDYLENGNLVWSNHVLFMPVMLAWSRAWQTLGVPLATALDLAASFGVALGVWAAHSATRWLGLERPRRAAFALLVATTPAVLTFGTVIELHGPFFGCAGAALLAFGRCVARPTATSALWLGLATGFAAGVHSTGHLELMLLWLLLLAERGWSRALVRDGLLAGGVHIGVLVAAALTFRSGPVLRELFTQHGLTQEPFPLGRVVTIAWHTTRDEWLVPFFPLALAPVVALGARAQRRMALATLASCAVYLALTTRVLKGAVEHGAYLLPLALPAALLTARALRPRLAMIGVAAALSWAIPFTLAVQERELNAPRSEQVKALTQGCGVAAIVSEASETSGFLHCDAKTPLLWVENLVSHNETASHLAAQFDLTYDSVRSLGRELWLKPRARRRLEEALEPQVREFWDRHALQRYRLSARRARGALVWVVERP